jgi:hypothetical protein
VSVTERVWRTEQKNYLRLLPQAIGVSPRGRSQRLERVLTDFGSEHSFQHAAARVLEHYGFEINASAVRTATLHHAGRAEQLLRKEYQGPFRVLPAVGQPYVIAEVDGSMLCTVAPGPRTGKKPREWKEIRLAAARGLSKTDTFYAATFGEVDEVGRRWGHCAHRAGWGLNSQVHALGDGAEWIRLQTREVFGQQATFLCDYYHVSEYLAEAAPGCRAQAPERWRRTQQDRLKRGALAKVIDALAEHLEAPGTPEEVAPVSNAHHARSKLWFACPGVECLGGDFDLTEALATGVVERRNVVTGELRCQGTRSRGDREQVACQTLLRYKLNLTYD